MPKTKAVIFPKSRETLAALGENLRLARLRRNIRAGLQAERAGISRATLHKSDCHLKIGKGWLQSRVWCPA